MTTTASAFTTSAATPASLNAIHAPPAKRARMEADDDELLNGGGGGGAGGDGGTEAQAGDAGSSKKQKKKDRAAVVFRSEAYEAALLQPLPVCTSPPNYRHGLFLAPMVRIGTLPTRLLSLQHGADLVWGPEIVDRAIMGATRTVHPKTGLIDYFNHEGRSIFSTHPVERSRLIFQLGSATPAQAYEAIRVVAGDIAGVDLNCGCPKPFSTMGGMGANLLTTPDILCAVLRAMRHAAPPHVAVTCKIRLLPTQEATLALVRQIIRTGVVNAITVHCRTKEMRPREPALLHRFREVAQAIHDESDGKIPVVVNGDCWSAEDEAKFRELTGATSMMMARGAEFNPSVFRREGRLSVPDVIVPQYIRYAMYFDNPWGNSKYCLGQLNWKDFGHQVGPSHPAPATAPTPTSAPTPTETSSKEATTTTATTTTTTTTTKTVRNRADALSLRERVMGSTTYAQMAEAVGLDPAELEAGRDADRGEVLEAVRRAVKELDMRDVEGARV